MIFGKSLRRNLRKTYRERSRLGFEALEGRKLLAADLMATGDTAPTQMHMPMSNHGGHLDDNARVMSMDSSCSGHQHHNPALMALVTDAQATHVATSSGNWSDPATWQNGQVPGQGARIVIAADQTVTVDREFNQEFKTIRVDGTLRFANNVNTQLKVDTLVSMACGRLEIGTKANPIANNVTAKVIFADDGAINRNWDPTELSRGALLMGTTEIHGAETTDKVTAAVQPRQGARSIQLSSVPTNWKAGDQIIITGTQSNTSDEVRTISSINGSTVNFNQALALDHVTPKEGLNVYIANKTRNVQFSSENSAIARRGHIMFMHTHNVNIDYAEFNDLGRTDKSRDLDDVQFEFDEDAVGNQAGAPTVYTFETESNFTNRRGRYAIHFHRAGVDPSSTPATVNGSVIDGSPGWGFVNHSSHVDFTANVAYGVWGSAYYTESGDEIGTFDGNIAIRSVNPRSPIDPESREIATDLGHGQQEFGNSGDGFWLSGHLVSVKNNISSGNTGHGIIIWSDGLVEHDLGANSGRTTVSTANIANGNLITGRTEIPTWWAPLAEVSNNEVSNATIGFRTRYIHSKGYLGEGGSEFHKTPDQAYVDTLNPVIDGLKVWGSREGIMLNYSERMSLKNTEVIGTGEPFVNQGGTTNVGVGLDLGNDISRGSGRIENVSIEGFGLGVYAPRNEQWVVDNLNLSNTTDMLLEKPTLSPRTLTMSNVNFGSLNGTAVAGTEGQRRNLVFFADPEFTEVDGQPFGFLMPDQITIDGQQIYANYQDAGYIPLTEQPDSDLATIPSSWVRRTNQQLQNQIGMSTSGMVTPSGAQQVDWITGGKVGPLSPAATNFPQLFDMTNGGFSPEEFPGGPVPELTGNRLEIDRGETVVLMNTNLNTTDTNTGIANLRYTASQVQNGYFAHRDNPSSPIISFTQAEVNGGVIRFVHDGSDNAPDYRMRVSDGTTTTALSVPTVTFGGLSDNSGCDQHSTVMIGATGNGVAISDNATGSGYLMYSVQNVHTRFPTVHPLNADHIVGVRHNGSSWQYNDNDNWTNFTPTTGDRLIAEANFSADTVNSLAGTNSTIQGIDAGYSSGDLNFTANRWGTTNNPGEFGVSGTLFNVGSDSDSTVSVTPLRNGVAISDDATGSGFLMYSVQNVHNRFPTVHPLNADHIVGVRHNGSSWQYNDNDNWINFTPTTGDRLIAEANFSADTVNSLAGTSSMIQGIDAGYYSGDLTFAANQWGTTNNRGEFGVSGTFFNTDASTTSTVSVTPLRNGVAVSDNATGSGFLMYSVQNVHNRFPTVHPLNADHVVGVRHNGSSWQYSDNDNWINFTPTSGDRLIAEANFSADTVNSLVGTSSTIQGIDAGFVDGDLVFTANQWGGRSNPGEFGISGSFFSTSDSGSCSSSAKMDHDSGDKATGEQQANLTTSATNLPSSFVRSDRSTDVDAERINPGAMIDSMKVHDLNVRVANSPLPTSASINMQHPVESKEETESTNFRMDVSILDSVFEQLI